MGKKIRLLQVMAKPPAHQPSYPTGNKKNKKMDTVM